MTALQPDLDTPAPASSRISVPWPVVAVLATAAAGGVHLAAAVTHRSSGDLHVAFFLVTALGQLGFAGLLAITFWSSAGLGRHAERRSPSGLLLAAVAGTVALLALYVVVHSTDWLSGLLGQSGQSGHTEHAEHVTGHAIESDGPVALDGTAAGTPTEQPDALGTANVIVEMIAVAAYTALLPRSWRGRTTNVLLVAGALAWVLWFTGGTL